MLCKLAGGRQWNAPTSGGKDVDTYLPRQHDLIVGGHINIVGCRLVLLTIIKRVCTTSWVATPQSYNAIHRIDQSRRPRTCSRLAEITATAYEHNSGTCTVKAQGLERAGSRGQGLEGRL